MNEYFLIGNLDKKQFIDAHNFTPPGKLAGYSAVLVHLCDQQMSGVLVYLLATSNSYPLMGTWAGDRVIVAGDEDLDTMPGLYNEMRESDLWEEISDKVTPGFFEFIQEKK